VPTHAAFLKGMNLGNRRLPNHELRGHVEAIGLTEVATFRASGNVVFTDPDGRADDALTGAIETELARLLGYPVATFVRSGEEVLAIAALDPFSSEQRASLAGKHQVMMLASAPTAAARRKALALATDQDALSFGPRELHWLPAGGISDSALDLKGLERALGPATVRTAGTIEQIASRHFGA